MNKIPIEIFVAEQLRQDRYKLIIAQIGLTEDLARLTLVNFFRDQGVHFVTPALAIELSQRVALELESREGVSGVARRMAVRS